MIILMLCWVAQPEYELHIFLTLVILDLKLWWRHKKRGSWRWAPFAHLHTCTCIILHRTALWNEAEWKLVMRSLLCTYCASCIQCAWWPCCRCRCTLSGKYRPIREHALLLTLHKMQQSLTEKMHNCTSTLKLHNGYTLIRNALQLRNCLKVKLENCSALLNEIYERTLLLSSRSLGGTRSTTFTTPDLPRCSLIWLRRV